MSYLNKRRKAFKYAWHGIRTLFRSEAHAQIHLVAAVLVTAAGFITGLSRIEWCLIVLCIGGVFVAEAFNTAIEKVCDKVSPERNPLIGAAKDLAAGAVLLFVFAAVAIGLLIFIPHWTAAIG